MGSVPRWRSRTALKRSASGLCGASQKRVYGTSAAHERHRCRSRMPSLHPQARQARGMNKSPNATIKSKSRFIKLIYHDTQHFRLALGEGIYFLRHLPETLFRFRAATRAPARLRKHLGHYSCRGTCFNPSPRPRAWSRLPNDGEAQTPTPGGVPKLGRTNKKQHGLWITRVVSVCILCVSYSP